MNFYNFNLSPLLLQSISDCKYTTPTLVQQQAIPLILDGQNLVVSAQTGSGKTAAYLIPIIERLITSTQRDNHTKALIIAPTRELAIQIGDVCHALLPPQAPSYSVVYGGVSYDGQINHLQHHAEIIIATPGRLMDLIQQEIIQLKQLQYFVLDEVDQMLDLGFRDSIIALAALRNTTCQTICFSATIPTDLRQFIDALLHDPHYLTVNHSNYIQEITQSLYYVERAMMDQLLFHLIRQQQPHQAVIFTRSRKVADRLANELSNASIPAEAFHSDRSQEAREYILGRFRENQTRILVATDVMARGIDIETISHIYNYGLPQQVETYIHRIGRTGRAGRKGMAITLSEPNERSQVVAIQKQIGRQIPIITHHPFATLAVTKALMDWDKQPKNKSKRTRKR